MNDRVMNDRKLLRTGVVGTAVAAVCCFTPLLVVVLGAAGLSVWLAWADYVLFPALASFIGMTVYALVRRARKPAVSSAAADNC